MVLAVGIDLVEVARVARLLERHGPRFLERCFTPRERREAAGRVEALAARLAAKEAAMKALGCGRDGVGWREVEVVRTASGAPQLRLHGRARRRARALGWAGWQVSLTHTRTAAAAVVVAWGRGGGEE